MKRVTGTSELLKSGAATPNQAAFARFAHGSAGWHSHRYEAATGAHAPSRSTGGSLISTTPLGPRAPTARRGRKQGRQVQGHVLCVPLFPLGADGEMETHSPRRLRHAGGGWSPKASDPGGRKAAVIKRGLCCRATRHLKPERETRSGGGQVATADAAPEGSLRCGGIEDPIRGHRE